MHLAYVLFTAMKKPLLNTLKTPVKYSLNSWGQGVTCIASQNGLRIQIGSADGRLFSALFHGYFSEQDSDSYTAASLLSHLRTE